MVQGTISVIIPAYNAGETLVRCLRGVLAQEDDDYEVIVVDDGSNDATLSVNSSGYLTVTPSGGVERLNEVIA